MISTWMHSLQNTIKGNITTWFVLIIANDLVCFKLLLCHYHKATVWKFDKQLLQSYLTFQPLSSSPDKEKDQSNIQCEKEDPDNANNKDDDDRNFIWALKFRGGNICWWYHTCSQSGKKKVELFCLQIAQHNKYNAIQIKFQFLLKWN